MSIPRSYWRNFIIIFFTLVFIFNLYQAFLLVTSSPPNEWRLGDWLINYQGGIVRRGLVGQIFFEISRFTGLHTLIPLLVGYQIISYLVFYINTCRLAIHAVFSPVTAVILLSPAFVLFSVLDPDGAFRKEILLFTLFSALCSHLVFARTEVSRRLPLYVGALCLLIVLSHEMLVVYLPYIVCAFILYEKKFGTYSKKAVIALAPAVLITVLLSLFSQGDRQAVSTICNSLEAYAPGDCFDVEMPGAISFLRQDIFDAHAFVVDSIEETTVLAYILAAILSFAPFALLYFSRQFNAIRENKETRRWLIILISAALIGSLPLLWFAADYGRIIYIHVTCLSLLALMASQDEHRNELVLNFSLRAITPWVLILFFIGNWRVMHTKATIDNTFHIVNILFALFNDR